MGRAQTCEVLPAPLRYGALRETSQVCLRKITCDDWWIMLAQTISKFPDVSDFNFRFFVGDDDFTLLCEVHNACNIADGLEEQVSVEEFKHEVEHLPNFHVPDDTLIVEHHDNVCGYVMVYYRPADDEGNWIHWLRLMLMPEAQVPEVEEAVLSWGENRLREKCVAPMEAERFFQTWCGENMMRKKELLADQGYAAIRYSYLMRRPNLDHIPESALPDGLEFRAVETDHLRELWAVRCEAFRDHWGHTAETEDDFQRWISDPNVNISLWRAVWDKKTNRAIGLSVNAIFPNDNARYGFKRGWLFSIGVLREWRKKGVASAVVVESLKALREAGMTESVLGVDAENPSGALRLYERLGYERYQTFGIYRKEM